MRGEEGSAVRGLVLVVVSADGELWVMDGWAVNGWALLKIK